MTFGEAVLKLRSERRISQRQLADELNVSFTSVNRWENGRTMYSIAVGLLSQMYSSSSVATVLPSVRSLSDI